MRARSGARTGSTGRSTSRARSPRCCAAAVWWASASPTARRRRGASPRGGDRLRLDVVTLFPDWFDWFRSQRHVANALAAGHELRTLDLREHTPLSGGQVDDTPFGGGAGMVLRVDVMDAALRGFYGVDPVDLRGARRVIALTPGGRLL